jgi:hypothetical protein
MSLYQEATQILKNEGIPASVAFLHEQAQMLPDGSLEVNGDRIDQRIFIAFHLTRLPRILREKMASELCLNI